MFNSLNINNVMRWNDPSSYFNWIIRFNDGRCFVFNRLGYCYETDKYLLAKRVG